MIIVPNSYGSALNESNDCHNPAGSSEGGQFCSDKGKAAAPRGRRAEFEGECQLCGHRQLLPRGALSQHGYAVKWNMFVGVCPGSRCKPFEQSIDRIEAAIDAHLNAAESLRKNAATLRQLPPEGETEAWQNVYFPGQGRERGGYRWVKVNVSEEVHIDEETGRRWSTFTSTPKSGELQRHDRRLEFGYGSDRPENLQQAVQRLNSKYADSLEQQAVQHEQYVTWQRQRIMGWEPKPLKPRQATPDPANVPLQRVRRGQWVKTPDGVSHQVRWAGGGTAVVMYQGKETRFKYEDLRKA